MIYVDKTALIGRLAKEKVPIFLSRPRRFGKSLLINTLSSLFSNGLEYFHGLDIEKVWNDKTYNVVHLDFSIFADDNAIDLKRDLGDVILGEFNYKGIVPQYDEQGARNPHVILNEILKKISVNEYVILIDEYDAPLTYHINDLDELSNITKILNNFYAVIKNYSGKFRFIFITGITRVSHVSIFSAFNNLLDLSFDDNYNNILGFTYENLEQYFSDYIEKAACILEMSENDILTRIQQHYDGYRFSLSSEQTLFNPWSIINFLMMPEKGFRNYWFDSGGTPSIIMQYLKINELFDFLNYNDRDVVIKVNKILKKYEITDIPREILLYQAGYFTIKNLHDGTAKLVFPNIEVEESLMMLYLDENNLDTSHELNQKTKKISDAIDRRDLKYIVDVFNEILNECASSLSKIFEDERSVRDLIYAALIEVPSIQQIKERDTAKGRSDLELITKDTYMIIEFKRTYHNRSPKVSLEQGIEQIKNNRYGILYSNKYSIYRVVMVISSEEKKILYDYCQEII